MTVAEQRYTRVRLLRNHEHFEGYFHGYINWIGRHTILNIGQIKSDNAKEFFLVSRGLEKLGVSLTTSPPHSPQSGGLVERINRTFCYKARAMMIHKVLREKIRTEEIGYVEYLHIGTATLELKLRTAMEALLRTEPNNIRLCNFKYETNPNIHKANRAGKYVPRVEKAIHLGNEYVTYRF